MSDWYIIWVSQLAIIGSDNGLLPGWGQGIIPTDAGYYSGDGTVSH